MTEREQQILAILRAEPLIAQQALAKRLGISRSAAAGHIMNLTQKGYLLGKGYVLADQRFVWVLGGANMDISGATLRALVAEDSNPGRIRCAAGGVARNVAENLARLGNDTRLISAVGDDLYGLSLLESTRRAGVDVQGCWVLPGEATSTYLSLHGPDGGMAVAVNDMQILDSITPQRLQAQAERVRHAAAIVVDCNVNSDALAWLFAHRDQTPVYVDGVSAFKCLRIAPWLAQIHLLKVNRMEAQALCGTATDSDAGITQAANWLHAQGVRQALVSLGERGAFWSSRGGDSGWFDAMPANVVNVTGAGDALMAGMVHADLNQMLSTDAVRFALACAALTLTTEAANHPSLSVASVEQQLTPQLQPQRVSIAETPTPHSF